MEQTTAVLAANELLASSNWRTLSKLSHPGARKLLPEDMAFKYLALPLYTLMNSAGGEILTLVCGKPLPATAELKFITGCEVITEHATEELVAKAILSAYSTEDFSALPCPASKFQFLLRGAISQDASDVHIEPGLGEGHRVLFRVDGELAQQALKLSSDETETICRYLKAKANLDLNEHDLPQEASFEETYGPLSYRVRLSILPTKLGQSLVLRVHELSRTLEFHQLGLDAVQQSIFKQSLSLNSGLILLSGPTGSGKSTLLYAGLKELAQRNCKIVTIEDPVEQIIPNVSQIEVNQDKRRSYHNYLPAVLRQDPEVIMIGEIRDSKTAKLALEASLTGHLVLSTMHAGSLGEITARLSKLGVSKDDCKQSFRLVVTQRLVALNCPHCRSEEKLEKGFREFFSLSKESPVFSAKGCDLCRQTGRGGRVGLYEMSRSVGKSFYPLISSLKKLLLSGEISQKTALRALGL